jgi:hypothetical protein
VAAAAGLVATDDDGTPLFCGDALADPLTGLTAAVLATSAPADGAGRLWDVSMTDVVARTLDGTPSRPAGDLPLALPRRREPSGQAPGPGADTAGVLRELGLPC